MFTVLRPRIVTAAATIFVFASCSQTPDVPRPTNKTATGALTGAAVGGGLGLIVGSTSGDAGEGMLVGSLAGGALGAGIGAKLQKDDETRAKEDTAIRQSESIKQQGSEINDLKKSETDELQSFYDAPIRQPVLEPSQELKESELRESEIKGGVSAGNKLHASAKLANDPAARSGARARMSNGIEYLSPPSGDRKPEPYGAGARSASVESRTASLGSSAGTKTAVKKPIPKSVQADSFAIKEPAQVKEASVKTVKLGNTVTTTVASAGLPAAATETITDTSTAKEKTEEAPKDLANCKDALKEAERGLHAAADADRLFYLRRAARLCPTEPSYHVELGKLYSAIGKSEDAKYELRQAIDLDPNNQIARDELSIIENTGGAGK